MKTPFVFGRIATKEDFTDRTSETQHLVQNFTSLINTIIISPRRWGKSSLVYKAAAEAQNDDSQLKICHLDLFNVRTEEQFYKMLVEAVLAATATKFDEVMSFVGEFLKQIVPKLTFSAEPSPKYSVELEWDRVRGSIDEVLDLAENIAIKKDVKIMICIDEFQNISYFTDSLYIQKRLRAHWQKHQHVGYCFYGSKRHMMMEVFAGPSMPFYKFGDLIFLQKISAEDMESFVRQRFHETGKSIDSNAARVIIELVDDHPYYTQQLAQLSWLRCKSYCDEQTVRDAHASLVEQLSLLFINLTESLTNQQVAYLHAIVDRVEAFTATSTLNKYGFSSATAVSRAKAALIEKDIIDTLEIKPTIQDPVYAYWLRHIYFKD